MFFLSFPQISQKFDDFWFSAHNIESSKFYIEQFIFRGC